MWLCRRVSWSLSKAICVCFGALLGIGCGQSTSPHDGPAPEYGMPYARYKLDGTVRQISGRPIEGIRVRMDDSTGPDSLTTAFTDAGGHWIMDTNALPCGQACLIRVDDIDGPAHDGAFAGRSVPIAPIQTEFGSGRWFIGTFEEHGIIVELWPGPPTPREDDPPETDGRP